MMERLMRRFKQELTLERTKEILFSGRECVIAVAGDDGYPYTVPVNYVYDGERIYIHSASSGHKIDALKGCPKISLCVIERGDIVPEEFTTYFSSAIVFGRARFVDDAGDKVAALRLLCKKYCGEADATAEIAKFLKSVAIIEITIDRLSGKQAIELTR